MEYNLNKVDEMVLALLYLTSSHNQYGTRAWKGLDLGVLDSYAKKALSTIQMGKVPPSF
jgi:hypothetical protein